VIVWHGAGFHYPAPQPYAHGAAKLRDNRKIGDFRRWKIHDAYKKTFDRLMRGLRVGTT
jgi:hypothetical protein